MDYTYNPFTSLLYECPDAPIGDARNPWNVPDWNDPSQYPLESTATWRWRWEFIRRRSDYRQCWNEFVADGKKWPEHRLRETVEKFGLLYFIPPQYSSWPADWAMPEHPDIVAISAKAYIRVHERFCWAARISGRQIIRMGFGQAPGADVLGRNQLKAALQALRANKPYSGSGPFYVAVSLTIPLDQQWSHLREQLSKLAVTQEGGTPVDLPGLSQDDLLRDYLRRKDNPLPSFEMTQALPKRRKVRARPTHFTTYLRLLDARAAGVRYAKIKAAFSYGCEEDWRHSSRRARALQKAAIRPLYE